MYLIATNNGLYKLDKELEKLTEGYEVNDVVLPYICSSEKGVISKNNEAIINEGCWRLWEYDNTIYASIEGPKIYEIRDRKVKEILNLTKEAEKLGWEFPYGPAHITDFALFKDYIVATVEEGNLLVGKSISELKPIDFFADMHNLLVSGENLLIATANGIYKTIDMKSFNKVIGGYAHGLEDLGRIVVAHIMSQEPLIISRDNGISWDKVSVKLPRPTFGVTAIAKKDERKVIYSTTAVYEVDIIEQKPIELVKEIPMTRRVIKV
ncbi:beta propeller repeat protein [Saccharolobus islandicus]|uniref:Uncharacterized protein n=1 Tax=Saccharolobus islandicus (strain REY15A) TaxID=930945 RepID=F0NEP0_SACI5|nr:hypothetical protein [Sulfolobus islandicus]ADX85023.1 conserved hypothetical protein [Sulfolobus islandicus REY15A]